MSGLNFFVIGALAGAAWKELINVLIRVIAANEEWKLMWRTLNVGIKSITNWLSSLRRSRNTRPPDQPSEASGGSEQADKEHIGSHSLINEREEEPDIGSSKDISGR